MSAPSTRSAVLLVNLGSPASPSVPDVREYLREFLSDPRVIDGPPLLRWFVVNCCVLPFRPKNSAEAYHSIWTAEGSPLLVSSHRLREKLQESVHMPVALAMRYGEPSIPSVVAGLARGKIDHIFLIPLYPHYAMSSFESVVVRVRECLAELAPHVQLTVQPPFFEEPQYIKALAESTRPWLDRGFDHLLASYHGVPERHLRKTDPTGRHCLASADCCEGANPVHAVCYRAQTLRTTRAFALAAGLPPDRVSISYQSRLGRDPWLTPYTDFELARLAQSGVRRLLVICPAFVSDCLETLEEIRIRGRETFLAAGGSEFEQIPCLNEHPAWIQALASYVAMFQTGRVKSFDFAS